jgi:hypothetical protein
MASRPSRIERALWCVAAACALAAGGVAAWTRWSGRSFAESVRGAALPGTCGPAGEVPETGPVPLPTCRGSAPGSDPWLVPGAHGPDLDAVASAGADPVTRRWRWVDVNTVPVLRWDGDVRVVKPGAAGRTLAVTVSVDRGRALAMERAFGYSTDDAVIRYRDDAELVAKRSSLDAALRDHGVQRRRTDGGDVLSPDYEWMIEASVADVRPVAQAVLAEARRRGARGMREEFGALSSFVQALAYGESPAVGDGKHRFGLSMPLWALATGTGDCDTRAVLLATLARSVRLCEVHLVRDTDHAHMFAAAAIPVLSGDRFVRAQGMPLVLVETTDDWPVGRVASRTRGERLQTVFLASATPAVSASAARPRPRPQPPSAMRAQRTEPEPGTSARSTRSR